MESFSVDFEDGFTFIKPQAINCNIVTCKHYETCKGVGEKSGILPIAVSILEGLGKEWRLPGHGKQYDDCGKWRGRGCLHAEDHWQNELDEDTAGKIYVEFYHRSCNRADCPICKEKWMGHEAAKIEHRLKFFWKYGKVLHIAVSPSEKDVLNIPYEKLRQKSYRIAKSRGVKGGAMIWHPFKEQDDGTWYFAPHFHVLGFGWVKNTKQGYEKDGWLVKNIPDGKEERSVFRTAMYQLSHCGLSDQHKNPVSWFGVCSTAGKNRVKVPEMEKEKHNCPSCGSELVQLILPFDDSNLPFTWADPDLDREGHWLDPDPGWIERTVRRYNL